MSGLAPLAQSIQELVINYKKQVTPEEIMGRSVTYAKSIEQYFAPSHSNSTVQSHVAAYKDIVENGAQFVSFDIEGHGGKDRLGVNRFDGMTELAFTIGDINNNNINTAIKNTEHFFFGVDKETYERLLVEVQQPGFATSTERGEVLANRLAIIGHKDTIIDGNQIYNEADVGTSIPTVQQMIDGLNRNYKAWQHNQKTLTADGLTDADRFKKRFVDLVNRKDVILTGHNIKNYDLPKLALEGVDVSKSQKMDTLLLLKEASKFLTTEEIFQVADDVQKGMKGKTSLTQENITERILGKQKQGLQAHTASVDSALHSMIISHPLMRNVIARLEQPDAASVSAGSLIPGQSLVLNKQSSYGDFNSMSFLVLPTGEVNTGNGYSFFEDKLKDNGFKPGILKKDTLYTFGGTGVMQLNSDDKKAMKLINGDYAQDKLYYVAMSPYGADETVQGSGTILQFFKSEEHLQEYINSVINMGNGVDLPANPVARARAEKQLKRYNLKTKKEEALSYNEWISEKVFESKQDRGARKVRNHSYTEMQRAIKIIDEIDILKKERSIVESVTGFDVKDMQFAARLANGERIAIGEGLSYITNKLNGDPKYNTIDNVVATSAFAYKNQDVIRKVMASVENNFKDESQRAFAYSSVMRQVVDSISSHTTEALKLSESDLNYVELPYSKLTHVPKPGKMINASSDLNPSYLRVNLDSKNAPYTLVDDLLEYRFGGTQKMFTAPNKDMQTRVALDDFAKAANLDIGDVMSYDKADDIASAIMIQLRKNKSQDMFYMIENKTINQSIEKGLTSISENYENNAMDIDSEIEQAIKNVPIISNLKKKSPESLAHNITSRFNKPINNTYFHNFEFDKKHANYMQHVYKQFEREQKDFYEKIFKEFKGYEGLGMIFDDDQFSLTYNNKVYDMREYIPNLKLHDDMAYIKVGNMEINIESGMQFDKKTGRYILGTNFQKSVNNAHFSVANSKKNIERGIDNPAEAIIKIFKQVNKVMRESSDVKLKNRMNKTKQFRVDTQDVMNEIPALVQNGSITVTKGELAILKRFADPDNTGTMRRLDKNSGSNASLNNILTKYRNKAMALIFNTPEYEGTLIRTVAKHATSYLDESSAADNYVSFAPEINAFGEYGPGNRITFGQNNYIGFDVNEAKKSIAHITDMPTVLFDHGITSKYSHAIGHSRLTDFMGLDKEISDQVVVKKLNITHTRFKNLIETHFSKGPQHGYTQEQWDKIKERMTQYGLKEDESIIDARILENIFWQQNELQKVRTYRKDDNNFVEDKDFKKMHEQLNWTIDEKDGKAVFKYGGQIERKRDDMLFKISGFRNTESVTSASYDGYLKLGIYAGRENIMLTEEDVNYLIRDMTKEQAEEYITGLDSYYYLDRKKKEPYAKMIVGNTEKTKSRMATFKVGELDTELQDLLPASLVGSDLPFKDLKARAIKLGVSEDLIRRIEKEHYATDIVKSKALGGNYAVITNENRLKHKGIDTHQRELFPSLRQEHIDKGMDIVSAAKQVQKDFAGTGFDFEVASDGTMLLSDESSSRTRRDFDAVRKIIKEKYKNIDPTLLEHIEERNGEIIGTSGMINIGRTKEHEISIVSAPIERTDQYYGYTQKINNNQNKITARQMLIDQINGKDVTVKGDEPWALEYQKLRFGIDKRDKEINKIVKRIANGEDSNTYLKELNDCVIEYEQINSEIKKLQLDASKISAVVNDPKYDVDVRRKYVTYSKETSMAIQTLEAEKIRLVEHRKNLTSAYTEALKQKQHNISLKNNIEAKEAKKVSYVNSLADRLQSQIINIQKSTNKIKTERSDFTTAYKLKNKGIMFDELAYMKMRNKVITKETFRNLASLVNEDTLKELGITEENVTSRPIFSNILKDILDTGMKNGSVVLTPESAEKKIKKIYGLSEVGQGILDIYKGSGYDALNLDIAEARYAISRMNMALDFNEGQKESDYLEKYGFRKIDIKDYQQSLGLDQAFVNQGDSVFGTNLIIDVNGESIAVPYMPHSVYGESNVQTGYESAIKTLQNRVVELGKIDESDKENYSIAHSKVLEAIENVKKSVHLVSAKGGGVAETITKSRHDTGFLAKSASFTDKFDAPLGQAYYKGKTISQWFDEDVFINAGFTSEQMFRDMGFFSDEVKNELNKQSILFEGGPKEFITNGNITDDQLREIYKTYGISGLSGRFPYIQEMSINAKQLYLDTNLEGNTIKNFLGEQMSKSSDNDGDYEAFMALKASNKDIFVAQATGKMDEYTKNVLREHEMAMGIDAIGMNKFNASRIKEAAEIEMQSEKVLEQARVYDRLFFDGKLFGEQRENPYFEEGFDIAPIRQKINKLEELTGGKLDYENPELVRKTINALDIADSAKIEYQEAVVKNLQVSAGDLASTAKSMKKAIGQVNLMMRDFDQAAEILTDSGHITRQKQKMVTEMSYAIQQESISPKNAKTGDIDIESIEDFKRILNAAKYGKPIEYKGENYGSAKEAMGAYLDATVKEKYLSKYAATENLELRSELEAEKMQFIQNNKIDEWGAREKEIKLGFYESSRSAMQEVLDFVTAQEVDEVRAYNALFTRGEETVHFYNSPRSRKGRTTQISQKDAIMAIPDDTGATYLENRIDTMIAPTNATYRHMFVEQEMIDQVINQTEKAFSNQEDLLQDIGRTTKITKGMAGLAVAGIGAYMLIGAMGNSVTANTTNQAEQFQGDTLSDYGTDYSVQEQSQQTNATGYVVNVRAKTSPDNVQKLAGQFNQSISSSLNANLNMTLNINEQMPKQFQIDKMIQNAIFNR